MADDQDTSLQLFNDLFLSKYKSISEDDTKSPLSHKLGSPSPSKSLSPKLDLLSEIQNTLRKCVEDIEYNKTNTEKLLLEKDAQIEATKLQLRKAVQDIKEEAKKIIEERDKQIQSLSLQLQNTNDLVISLQTQIDKEQQEYQSTLQKDNRQTEILNSTISALQSEIEEWKTKYEQVLQTKPVNLSIPPNMASYLETKEGEVKTLRARLEADHNEMNMLRQQIALNKKQEDEIRKEYAKEIQKLKTSLAFKDHEYKQLQDDYSKAVSRESPKKHTDTPAITVEEFVETTDQSDTPRKRRISLESRKSPSRSPKRNNVVSDDEEEPVKKGSAEEGGKMIELKPGKTGTVRIMIEPC